MHNSYNIGQGFNRLVNIDQPAKINYWKKKFGCSESQLIAAIDRANYIEGSALAEFVKQYL